MCWSHSISNHFYGTIKRYYNGKLVAMQYARSMLGLHIWILGGQWLIAQLRMMLFRYCPSITLGLKFGLFCKRMYNKLCKDIILK